MKLKEKFLTFVYCFMGSGMLTNTYDAQIADWNAKECEKITEEFATEFANWLNNKVITKSGSRHHLLGKLTVEELLPIFKREKGL